MVIYFSGTGNSLYIAKGIANGSQEKLVSIAQLVKENDYTLELAENESIGFVFPVHGFAPPDIVVEFIKKVNFKNYNQNYMYSICNCAGTPEYTSKIIRDVCSKRGFLVSYFLNILMPGNTVIFKKQLPEEKCQQYLSEVDSRVNEVVEAVKNKESNYKDEKHSFVLSYIVHKLLVLEKNEKFVFGDKCVSCGKCSRICPMDAISIESGKPVRNAKKCVFCLACVNVCPNEALEIGKKTVGNRRYVNPSYEGFARIK